MDGPANNAYQATVFNYSAAPASNRPVEPPEDRVDVVAALERPSDAVHLASRRRRKRNYWVGDELADIVTYTRIKPLGYLKQAKLIEQAQKGDQAARNTVWSHHLRLAMSVVNQFFVPKDMIADALQEAIIGLERAIMRFDVHRFNSFSTYAWFWIAQRVRRFLHQQRFPIPIPAYLYQDFTRFCVGRNACRTPSEWFDWQDAWLSDDGESYFAILRLFLLTHSDLRAGDTKVLDCRPDPEQILLTAERNDHIRQILSEFPGRIQEVIIRRYGLDGGDEMTLEDIAQQLGLTRERIRQIQKAAEDRMRPMLVLHDDCRNKVSSSTLTTEKAGNGIRTPA